MKHSSPRTLSLAAFAERLTAAMPVLCASMLRHERNALTDGRLSLPQFWAMAWLEGRPAGAPMHNLAAAMELKAPTATLLVDRLCRQKWVRRQHDPADRRRVIIHLTPAGRRLVHEVHATKRQALQETFRALSADERNRYLELIETLAARLQPTLKDPS
jgi:DNA-binding MarR family transcriptional regulator